MVGHRWRVDGASMQFDEVNQGQVLYFGIQNVMDNLETLFGDSNVTYT